MAALTWTTTHKYGKDSLAHQFPFFQIDAARAGTANIRVEARAPNGSVQELNTSNNNGVFTANFTPSQIGKFLFLINFILNLLTLKFIKL